MNTAIEQTISFILIIFIGIVFKHKFLKKEDLRGIKILILSIALPATIFIALLKTQFNSSLLFLPFVALVFNFLMLGACVLFLPRLGFSLKSPGGRTMIMLVPSLAPGLSCFPYILEYLGKDPLAWAALADVGNKIFVLIFLYLLAMSWYSRRYDRLSSGWKRKIKELVKSLLKEPINMVLIVGLTLMSLGFHFASFPLFLQNTLDRLSNLMTPMVLLYIGLAVKFQGQKIANIIYILLWRMGLSFCLSAITVLFLPINSPEIILLAVIFPLSSCSFWPYAHMCAFDLLEKKVNNSKQQKPLFDLDLALTVLAISLPLSTMMVLGVCVSPQIFIEPKNLFVIGSFLIVLPMILLIKNYRAESKSNRLAFKKELSKHKK